MKTESQVCLNDLAPKPADQALIISVTSGEYTHALARDAQGRVVAAFHRNLRTGEEKL